MSRSQVESFLRTLLLGDFEQNQNTAAQVVGGLISLIPVLDQVMDARDITGALYNVNQSGGFKNASTAQIVNLGFAAFGAIPTVGSAFKTVFKPLWKERRAAKGAVNGGVQALERLLGMKKGGALDWMRKELLGKWAARTNEAIYAVNAALDATIELTEFLATASGWKDWLIPDPIQDLAKQILPGLKSMRGKLSDPLQRASNEIRHLLEDLLGEQAAAVVMAVGQRAVLPSAVPGTRQRSGHNAAAIHNTKPVPARQGKREVASQPSTQAKKTAGPVAVAVQATRKALGALASQEKGLIGEHVVDYHELKRLQGGWPHDKPKGAWKPTTVSKLNVDKRPVNLSLQDLPKVNHPGIDAVWQHGAGQLTVTEAKASASIGAVYGLGQAKQKRGQIPSVSGLSNDHQVLHYLLSDSSDKRGMQTPLMQMGKAWVEDRARREGIGATAKRLTQRESNNYQRRVALVTLESSGALAHVEALADVHLGKSELEVHKHTEHEVTRVWEAVSINAVDEARKAAHRAKQKPTTPAGEPSKPAKPSKGKK